MKKQGALSKKPNFVDKMGVLLITIVVFRAFLKGYFEFTLIAKGYLV